MITDTQYCHVGLSTVWKVSKYGVFAGPYFSVFGLNTESYGVNLRIQYEYGKTQIRRNSAFGHFSRSAGFSGIKQLEMLFVKQWRSKFKPFSFTIFILISLYTSKKKKILGIFISSNLLVWTFGNEHTLNVFEKKKNPSQNLWKGFHIRDTLPVT